MTASTSLPRPAPVADPRSSVERMLAGELHYAPDPELTALQNAAREKVARFNATPRNDPAARIEAARALLGRIGRSWIESPFSVDYGVHVEIGDLSFINMNCTFLDSARIRIGNYVLLGPGVQLITATHPTDPDIRHVDYPDDPNLPMRCASYAKPITIGDHVWIGAGAIVLPGVTIGEGSTIGAGSVVTRSIPARVVAAGNPAHVIREVTPFAGVGPMTAPARKLDAPSASLLDG